MQRRTGAEEEQIVAGAGEVRLVQGENDGDIATSREGPQEFQQGTGRRRVQGRDGFVREEHPRLLRESAGHGDPLPLPSRERVHSTIHEVLDADSTQGIVDLPPVPSVEEPEEATPRRDVSEPTAGDVLEDRESRKEIVTLGDERDGAAPQGASAGGAVVAQLHPPDAGPELPGEDAQAGRFARSRGPEKREQAPADGPQVHSTEGHRTAAIAVVQRRRAQEARRHRSGFDAQAALSSGQRNSIALLPMER